MHSRTRRGRLDDVVYLFVFVQLIVLWFADCRWAGPRASIRSRNKVAFSKGGLWPSFASTTLRPCSWVSMYRRTGIILESKTRHESPISILAYPFIRTVYISHKNVSILGFYGSTSPSIKLTPMHLISVLG
jgi:hypothetical protein